MNNIYSNKKNKMKKKHKFAQIEIFVHLYSYAGVIEICGGEAGAMKKTTHLRKSKYSYISIICNRLLICREHKKMETLLKIIKKRTKCV